ncbi:hypothetical protein CR513_22546, partial [Mucuna pruriens]
MIQLMGEKMPKGNIMVTNLYHAGKSMQILGLGCLRIDYCSKGCILYYNENSNKSITNKTNIYMTINRSEVEKKISVKKMWYFPLIPRLKRLYSSIAIASHMMHFDRLHLEFSQNPKNVRLRLYAYGFNPFTQYGKIILTSYNLPPMMCMKREFMFLTILISSPSNPKHKIDPIIDELCTLWDDDILTDDILTYDVSLR